MDDRDLTQGDPLDARRREHREGSLFNDPAAEGAGSAAPAPDRAAPAPERTASVTDRAASVTDRAGAYAGGPVPPGAFAARPARPPLPREDELAGFGRRALALLLDALVVALIVLVAFALLGAVIDPGDDPATSGDSSLLTLAAVALTFLIVSPFAALLYLSVFMARTNGQTIGKFITGCRVVRTNGKRVDFGWAAWREVVVKGLLLGIAGVVTGGLAYLANFLWPLFDPQKRALHDFVADSRVVRKR